MHVAFLIGGTEPAGTNQLYHLLTGHADVCLPVSPQPEPNFFSKALEHAKGADYYHRRYFAHYADDRVAGEKSGRYLWHPDAARRIHAYNPAMRMIFLLRDPVERAYSNYRFNCLNGIETLDFTRALEAEDARVGRMKDDPAWRDVQPFAYFDKGLYAAQLERYLEVFPRGQIHVLDSEALRRDPRREVTRVLDFLGLLAARYRFVEDAPEYPSFHVRSLFVQKAIRTLSRPFLERLMIKRRSGERPTLLERVALLNFSDRRTRPAPDTALALRLRYRDDLARLRRLVDFDTGTWIGDTGRNATAPVPAPTS